MTHEIEMADLLVSDVTSIYTWHKTWAHSDSLSWRKKITASCVLG